MSDTDSTAAQKSEDDYSSSIETVATASKDLGPNHLGDALSAPSTVQKRLLEALKSNMGTDIEMVGDDGIPVAANRFILASASKVLERMLYGAFSESNRSTIKFPGYNSSVLRAVIEFCCTDDIGSLDQKDECEVEVKTINAVLLARYAHVYHLPEELRKKAIEFVRDRIDDFPFLACTVFNESDSSSTPELENFCMRAIRFRPRDALRNEAEHRGIQVLMPDKLTKVIADKEIREKETFLFDMLTKWKQANEDKYDNVVETCKMLSKSLDLYKVDPHTLKDRFLSSEIIDKEQVMNAFMEQALRAARNGILFSAMRCSSPHGQEVSVSGAGLNFVNGTYLFDPNEGYYKKRGHWRGSSEIFHLFRCIVSSGAGHWYIAVCRDRPGTNKDIDFYSAPEIPNYPKLPPGKGWKKEREGVLPPPRMSLHGVGVDREDTMDES